MARFYRVMVLVLMLGMLVIGLGGCADHQPKCLFIDANDNCNLFRDVVMPNAWRLLSHS